MEILIDSSGLKVRREGEWKLKIYVHEKRRGWIKLPRQCKKLLPMEPMIDLVVESIYLKKVNTVVFLQDEVDLASRNDSLQIIRNLGNDKEAFSLWIKLVGYHKKALLKRLFHD